METIPGIKTLAADKTKNCFISLWEQGGARTKTGNARIIAKADGSKPTATYIRRKGTLSCAEHAMIPIHKGYWVIDAVQHRGNFTISVMQITGTSNKNGYSVITEELFVFEAGKWNKTLPQILEAPVEAARKKAADYHCRTVYFAVQKEKEEK